MGTQRPARPAKNGDTPTFWGEMSPCDHVVQIYKEYSELLDGLEGYVAGGLQQGDAVIVIATDSHVAALEKRLKRLGLPLEDLKERDQFIVLDAEATLARFMINNWPDQTQFELVVHEALARAHANGAKRVRAFGEMVAILWAQGHFAATVRLELLWRHMCDRDLLSLYCAYPRLGFTTDASESIREICAAHTRVFPEPA
jgi:hypothetical protein